MLSYGCMAFFPFTDEDVSAALEVQRLSADGPIDMLASDPDRFFGRTTKVVMMWGGITLD